MQPGSLPNASGYQVSQQDVGSILNDEIASWGAEESAPRALCRVPSPEWDPLQLAPPPPFSASLWRPHVKQGPSVMNV